MDIDTRWRTVSPAPDPSSVAGGRLHDEREPIFDQGLAFDLETLPG